MPASPYIARLRAKVGTELLVLPTVAVLPRDADGRVLLVRAASTSDWMTIGGMVEPDEAPEGAAVREAKEEAGVTVALTRLVAALGGPDYRFRYGNGDEVTCVVSVYEATVIGGEPIPDGDETSGVGWFDLDELFTLSLNRLNRSLLTAVVPTLG